MNLQIDQEFKTLIPPLTDEEYRQLTDNLVEEGCRDALIVWNGTIIDGHNRYEICKFHNIEFRIEKREFANRDEAKEWIIRNQFGRRNLSAYDRSKLALQLEEVIKVKAKENKQLAIEKARTENPNNVNEQFPQKSAKTVKPIETREEIAKIAGVSHDTIDKVKIIEREATPEQKQRLSKGDARVNTIYRELRPKKEDKPVIKKPDKPKMDIDFTIPTFDENEVIETLPHSEIVDELQFLVNEFMHKAYRFQYMHERIKTLSSSQVQELRNQMLVIKKWAKEFEAVLNQVEGVI